MSIYESNQWDCMKALVYVDESIKMFVRIVASEYLNGVVKYFLLMYTN